MPNPGLQPPVRKEAGSEEAAGELVAEGDGEPVSSIGHKLARRMTQEFSLGKLLNQGGYSLVA
jgi:hypothetical protein